MHLAAAAGFGPGRFLLRSLTVAAAWASILAAGLSDARAQGPESVTVPLGADFQGIVDANPPGTRYVLAAGVHRGLTVIPKDGDVITGEPGAVLNGCLALESWEREGDWWVHTAPVLVPTVSPNGIDCADSICLQPQDFYLDGVRLKPVSSLSKMFSGKEWYLDHTRGKVYLAADPTGLLAEFGGPARTAIDCSPFDRPPAIGVVIEDLTIEKYPCPPQVGAVRLGGGGTIRRCTVAASHSYGIQLMRGPALVQDCYLVDNGMCGIGGTGMGATIEGCEIAHNVWPIYAGKAWDNGGVKLAATWDTIFRRNYVHHNHGPGFWVDIKTTTLTVEDNIIEFNDWEGILIEISEQAVVRRNICRWNGVLHRRALWGAQICVQNSSSVEIYSNFLETGEDNNFPLVSHWGSRQGIIVINQLDRAWDERVFQGDFSVHEILVRNNVHVMPSGGHNGVDYGTLGWDSYEDFLGAKLEWRDNRYLLGQPLDHYWSWRREPNWDATVGKWLAWEDWLTEQDKGSTLERIGPFDYPPTGVAQHPLILATTGNNYSALKAQLTRRPPRSATDRDEDGLPDEWERELVSSLDELIGPADPDGDGVTTAEEFAAGTDPIRADTDGDQLPDAWEAPQGLNPLLFDSQLDEDGDGRSAVEEWQDGTSLKTPDSLDLPAAEASLRLWLTPTAHLSTDTVGNLTRWMDSGPLGLSVSWLGSPRMAAATPTGVRLVDPGPAMAIPGHDTTWGTPSSGCTLTFVFQPTAVELTREWRAILTNEKYLEQGFRLRLESGHLVFTSGQSGGSLNMTGYTRLEAGRSYLITISIEPNGRGGSMYLDGRLEAHSRVGFVVPSRTRMMLTTIGGVVPQPSLFGDIIVFNRRLSNRERRSLEGFLQQKYFTGVSAGDDDDRDGLPTAWETAHQIDALTPNALADDDRDEATNLIEWQRGLDPQRPDTDGDGLPDGWEIRWQTNPLVADAGNDADTDGLSNREEFENDTSPLDSNADPLGLDFNKMRLWWRANHGLEFTEDGLTQWLNSAPGGGPGRPREAAPIPLSPDLWKGHPVLRLSDNPVLAERPVDLATQLHPAGLTVAAAVSPPAGEASPGFHRLLALGEILIGVEAGNLVMRNETGSISATASVPVPAGPFIVSCMVAKAPAPAHLRINGSVVAEATGLTPPASTQVSLGGPDAWPADIAEVIVHAGVLTPLHRRFVERVLAGKWLGSGPLTGDVDADGLADWWEHEACSQVAVPDATDDSDWNGESNLVAFEAGRPGFVWVDGDADGLHDHWERFHALDPARDDAAEDPDQDGLPNAHEQALASHPRTLEADSPWNISPAPATAAAPVVLSLRSSQRSWSQRARWESSTSLETGTWRPLAPGRVTGRGPGVTLLEEIFVIPGTGEGSDFSWLRLRLFRE